MHRRSKLTITFAIECEILRRLLAGACWHWLHEYYHNNIDGCYRESTVLSQRMQRAVLTQRAFVTFLSDETDCFSLAM